MTTEEPIGVMKCWECVEKHARDLEHHYEDIIRVETDPAKRLKYEEAIDYIRTVRKEAHQKAKGIAIEEDLLPKEAKDLTRYWELPPYEKRYPPKKEENPAFHVRYIDLATGKTHEKDIAEREQYDLIKLQREGEISIIEITPIKEKKSEHLEESEEEIHFSEPIRRERGKEVYVDVYHEKEECEPSSFRVIKPNPEHILTICCPFGQYSHETGRCLVGTMAQKLEHLHEEIEGECPVCEATA